jgi:hypothetical protein
MIFCVLIWFYFVQQQPPPPPSSFFLIYMLNYKQFSSICNSNILQLMPQFLLIFHLGIIHEHTFPRAILM